MGVCLYSGCVTCIMGVCLCNGCVLVQWVCACAVGVCLYSGCVLVYCTCSMVGGNVGNILFFLQTNYSLRQLKPLSRSEIQYLLGASGNSESVSQVRAKVHHNLKVCVCACVAMTTCSTYLVRNILSYRLTWKS